MLCVTYTGHADIVRCCCYSPDGSRIVSCSDDTLVKVMRQTCNSFYLNILTIPACSFKGLDGFHVFNFGSGLLIHG